MRPLTPTSIRVDYDQPTLPTEERMKQIAGNMLGKLQQQAESKKFLKTSSYDNTPHLDAFKRTICPPWKDSPGHAEYGYAVSRALGKPRPSILSSPTLTRSRVHSGGMVTEMSPSSFWTTSTSSTSDSAENLNIGLTSIRLSPKPKGHHEKLDPFDSLSRRSTRLKRSGAIKRPGRLSCAVL